MAKYARHSDETAAWLAANGINIDRVPADSDLTIRTDQQGQRTIHYEELICNEEGRIIDFGGHERTDRRSVPLTVEPPSTWRPFEKPTREQLLAAVDRVRAMAEAANTKPKPWALHPAAVLDALDGRLRPDTVLTFDGQLTEEEYEELKARWIREHGGRPTVTVEQRRADQAEDLLRVAHETSNRSEAERASAVRRAELADAVTAETKRLMQRRTTTLRKRAETAEQRRDELAATLDEVLRHFVHPGHPGEPCLGAGWIAEKTVNRWRAVLNPPAA